MRDQMTSNREAELQVPTVIGSGDWLGGWLTTDIKSMTNKHRIIKLGRANASRAGLDAALRWIEECRRLGWPESQFDDLESLWWEHHDKDGNLNPPNDKLSDRASKT